MLEVKSVDEVMQIIRENFRDIYGQKEVINIREAAGRIAAEDIASEEDIPGFNRSMVDGYAVISGDTFGASDSLPAQLQLAGEVKMGEKPDLELSRGITAYIPTGGELPRNSDAVVMIEYTDNYGDGYVYINKPVAPGSNVIFKGDDIKKGDVVVKAGQRLRPQDIGVLGALGKAYVPVKRKIKVGIISTGDEIIDINEKPDSFQNLPKVRDVNFCFIFSALLEYGADPVYYGIIKDNYEEIRRVTEKALSECDVVLISGGSSVGNKDETFRIINSFGEPGVLVHGIAVKPGKPTIIGKTGNKALVGLPGHPASAFFIFNIFVLRILDEMYGVAESEIERVYGRVKARISFNYPSNHGREEFVPVRLVREGESLMAEPVFGKSGLISMLSRSDGYIRISRGSEGIAKGQEVEVILFRA